LTGGMAAERREEKVEVKPISAMATAMSSSRNLDARRRLSQSAQLRARPLLVEA
jgi:omega-6 fatty acid desaturase (delta-12 desaturase)